MPIPLPVVGKVAGKLALFTPVAAVLLAVQDAPPPRAAAQPPAAAQEQKNAPPEQRTAPPAQGRRGAGGTREFLGLGRQPDAAAAARGKPLFVSNCSFCHGATARGGDTGPDLLRSSVVLHDNQGEEIGPFLRTGRAARGMPAFPALTPQQTADIAEYLHMQVELAANRGTYKVGNIVTGDATAGKQYFQGAGGCTGCHSAEGDLLHIGSRLDALDLQQAFLYPAARGGGPGALGNGAKVKVTTKSGETLAGTLKRLDDFYVSFTDSNGVFRTLAREVGVKVEVEDPLATHRRLLSQYTDQDMHNLTAYLVTLK